MLFDAEAKSSWKWASSAKIRASSMIVPQVLPEQRDVSMCASSKVVEGSPFSKHPTNACWRAKHRHSKDKGGGEGLEHDGGCAG